MDEQSNQSMVFPESATETSVQKETSQATVSSADPENKLVVQLAQTSNRIIAFIIDIAIVFVVGVIIRLLFAIPPMLFAGASIATNSESLSTLLMGTSILAGLLSALVLVALWIVYYVVVPARYIIGQTLGKKLMDVKIVKTNGSAVDLMDMLKRNLIYLIGTCGLFIPVVRLCFCCLWLIVPLINLVLLFTDPKRQTLNDKIADTVVVEA